MANTLAALVRCTNFALCPNLLTSIKSAQIVQPQVVRHLYAKSSLGIDGFKQQCERSKTQLANIADKFRDKMREYSSEESKNMIFTEDLKNMIHMAENAEDVTLVTKMMKRFNQQNKQLRFGNFIFGPVVMRMFHILNKADDALECFKSTELQGFFDQLITYQLLLDLLYENQKYDDMLEVFQIIKDRQLEGSKFPRNIIVLTLAACYKLNSPESLKFALNLWTELNSAGHLPMRRAITFCAGLALHQGEPAAALEIISSTKNQSYTTVRNIKVAALAELGRVEDAIPILKSILDQDTPDPDSTKQTFNQDVMDRLKIAAEKSGNTDVQTEFARLEKFFVEQEHLSAKTLDEQLCMEIVTPPFLQNQRNQNQPRFNKYNNQRDNQDRRPNKFRVYSDRPGLSELQ